MLKKVSIISIFITVIICIFSIYQDIKKKKNIFKGRNLKETEEKNFFKKNRKYIMLFLILLSAIIYLFKLKSVPQGLNVDEAGIAYDAMSLSKFGVDRYLYHFPIYFINFGGGQNALYTYLAAILIKIFGYNLFVLRLPAAFFGVLSIIFFYKLLEKDDSKTAFISSMAMLISPFFIMKSRWGLESYLFLPMLLFSIFALNKALETGKNIHYLMSGILFGLTLYTYAISYAILPIFLGISAFYLLITKKIKFKKLLILAFPIFILAIPLMLLLLINNDILPREIKTSFLSIPKLLTFRGSEISFNNIKDNLYNWHLFKVIFYNDNLYWNCSPKYGTFYYISLPLIFYGLIVSIIKIIKDIKERKYTVDIMMFLIFIIMFSFAFLLANVNVNKINCLYLPLVYYLSLGLQQIIKNCPKLSLIIIIMFCFFTIHFLNYYYNIYPIEYKDSGLFVSNDYNRAIDFAQAKRKKKQKIYVGGVVQPYIYVLIHDKANPYDFNKSKEINNLVMQKYQNYVFTLDDKLDSDMIFIIDKDSDNYKKIKKLKLKEKSFNKYIVFY